ncbi:Nodulation protein S (NodS) [Frankineae bacterium MT45]|nr:Nodulation protein S (NodS) [Frankineae bacterium MT45]
MTPSLPAEYFTQLYADSDDPWRIADGWYEHRKRAVILASLPRERFAVAFEPGCSNGELTIELASRCDRLIAWDVVDAAVERTRDRTADLPGVEVRQGSLPNYWPQEQADLILLSEVGYYLDQDDLEHAIDQGVDRLLPGGTLIAVHWRHPAPGYPLTGDRVHEIIGRQTDLVAVGGYRDADFLLDIWTHGSTPSIAEQSGVL